MGPGLVVNRTLNIGVIHLDADMPLKFFTTVVRWDIRRARRLGLKGLVVVMREVKGFPPPDVMTRKDIVTDWAESARGDAIEELTHYARAAGVRLALAVPEDYIDCDRIGVKIASDQGLTACIVNTEQEAIDWMVREKNRLADIHPI